MLRILGIIFWSFIVPSLATPPDYRLCPVGCNCTNYVATCDTLDFPSFTQEFLELRLIRVKQPINIDADFFTGRKLLSLTNLYIESSTIGQIDPAAFQADLKLNTLHFVNCTLPDLKPDTFLYATSLKLLNIDQCNLEKIETFKSESLTQLKISFCKIKEITKSMFETLNELTDLNLQGNKIETIEPGSFMNLIFLTDLNLSYNNISKLPGDIFDETDELVSVDLRGNPLQKIDMSIFSNLEQLILSNCQLREFVGTDLAEVVNLDLSNNLLTDLPNNAFSDMGNLEYLNLSRNRLTTLPSDVFANNSRLSKIILDRNDLQRLPKFRNSENFLTQFFSCNDCGLESVEPDVFEDMPSLISLHLSNNRIQKLDADVFSLLKSLTLLDISYNSIQNMDVNIFRYNTGLKTLNLAANNIPYIDPDVFANNPVIETLDVSNNGMKVIWKGDAENVTIPSLSVLNLADNRLSKITLRDLQVLPGLKVLNLNNNDLQCTMEFKAAVRWLNMGTVIHSASGMNAELTVDQMMTKTDPYWDDLYNLACDYDRDDYDEGEDEDIDIDEEEYGKEVYNEIEMLRNERIMHDDWIYTRERYTFLWSILVFVVTALFVLFMVTNIILCILRKRGQLPRNINLTWKNGGHSGFVYKPLTEDISRPRSIIIAQGDKLQAPNL